MSKNKKIFDYRGRRQNFRMDQEELPRRIKVFIRLSSARKINTIKASLKQNLQEFECEEQGNVITVSGYPPNGDFDAGDVLNIVQRHDPGAVET